MTIMTHASRSVRHALVGAALLTLVAISAQATDVRHWKREPIDVALPVGTERIIVFGTDVRVGLPKPIADPDVLRVQSTGGAVYLKANKPFDAQRVQVQDMQTGRIMLLDLSGVAHGSHETIRIENDAGSNDDSASSSRHAPGTPADRRPIPPEAFARGTGHRGGPPLPVQLVRHAAQALYAPQRIVHHSPGIHRVAIHTHSISGLMPAYPVRARALAAWRAAPYTVTAIQITNREPNRRFALDPRNLAGDFYAASFMQPTVGPAGRLSDTTTLFAVTKNGGLSHALRPPAGALTAEADDAD
ncbi:TIGR03749 family integrating conjugative element protein [Salinisphaera orenii]|uniref:TIGR03749 family integrating conjugative element protein n=1 Tax=Salinisphaera orenii TaxID=856731 RepID=UPI000DBE37AD